MNVTWGTTFSPTAHNLTVYSPTVPIPTVHIPTAHVAAHSYVMLSYHTCQARAEPAWVVLTHRESKGAGTTT